MGQVRSRETPDLALGEMGYLVIHRRLLDFNLLERYRIRACEKLSAFWVNPDSGKMTIEIEPIIAAWV